MLMTVWHNFLLFLEKSYENQFLVNLLKQTSPVSLTEKSLVLNCKNQAVKIYLEKKKKEIEKKFNSFTHSRISLELIVVENKDKKKGVGPLFFYQNSLANLLEKANIDERYSFENFAVSSSNQVAFAAAQAVSEKLGKNYNPLFIYGSVGVGKTHLACAIGRRVLEKNQDKKVFFCPGDQFTNELIESIRNKSTTNFRKKYRSLDLLIIDDVQFIAGKQTVQEEFFHTFNTIIGRGGQIILISDRPLMEIKNLEDRLRSRFAGGLTVDIQPPDFELRTAILLIKAKEKNINIDIEAAKMIAEKITDARSLEGSLISIYAKMINPVNINNQKAIINVNEVQKHLLNDKQVEKKRNDPEEIIKVVASYYNLKPSQIKSNQRSSTIAQTRQILMFLFRQKLNLTLEKIASLLKRKDHTTVIHGINKILHLTTTNPSYKEEIDRLIKILNL